MTKPLQSGIVIKVTNTMKNGNQSYKNTKIYTTRHLKATPSLLKTGISVVKRGPNPRFSPSLPRFSGFGAGTGQRFEKKLGEFWGWGQVLYWGFLGLYPRKSPKKFGVILGTGITLISGFFWGFIPNKPQKMGMGTGITLNLCFVPFPKIYSLNLAIKITK